MNELCPFGYALAFIGDIASKGHRNFAPATLKRCSYITRSKRRVGDWKCTGNKDHIRRRAVAVVVP